MPSTESFLRQISRREESRSASRRWGGEFRRSVGEESVSEGWRWSQKMEGGVNNMYGIDNGGMSRKKRVMVVVDQTSQSNHATMWALTHVANKGDVLTLLHVITDSTSSFADSSSSSSSSFCATSLGSLCKASRPEVEVEVLVLEGPKLATVMNQVKKLEVSVLVLGQRRPSSFFSCFCGSGGAGDLVEQCINNAECLTIGVRKQSRDMGGYVINTRWQKNFWLLA
ncbi:hypothetical protein SDJN02_21601, partial [Cucurbita argyrosperma subsp. argyrosperma]